MKDRLKLLNAIRDKIAYVNQSLARPLAAADVRSVVVILGGSRSGSSFLFSLLSETGGFWAPQGEDTPFYRLANLGWVNREDESDELCAPWSQSALTEVTDGLLRDLGRPTEKLSALDRQAFIQQAATRLLMQWPALDLDPENVITSLRHWYSKSEQAPAFWANWLESAGIGRGRYDLEGFPEERENPGALPDFLLEEPPFVIQRPRSVPATAEDLQSRTLLLKTSTNAYRIPMLRALFPQAYFRWVVLSRNPAASINGLMDGWNSNAFHSHNLEGIKQLNITGYPDRKWWKFDLPPGWHEFTSAPLERVCAFQWSSAYRNLLAQLDKSSEPIHWVRYEDLIDSGRRARCFAGLLEFAGVAAEPPSAEALARPVMASQPPVPARWRAREAQIRPVLADKSVIEIAARLNYDLNADLI